MIKLTTGQIGLLGGGTALVGGLGLAYAVPLDYIDPTVADPCAALGYFEPDCFTYGSFRQGRLASFASIPLTRLPAVALKKPTYSDFRIAPLDKHPDLVDEMLTVIKSADPAERRRMRRDILRQLEGGGDIQRRYFAMKLMRGALEHLIFDNPVTLFVQFLELLDNAYNLSLLEGTKDILLRLPEYMSNDKIVRFAREVENRVWDFIPNNHIYVEVLGKMVSKLDTNNLYLLELSKRVEERLDGSLDSQKAIHLFLYIHYSTPLDRALGLIYIITNRNLDQYDTPFLNLSRIIGELNEREIGKTAPYLMILATDERPRIAEGALRKLCSIVDYFNITESADNMASVSEALNEEDIGVREQAEELTKVSISSLNISQRLTALKRLLDAKGLSGVHMEIALELCRHIDEDLLIDFAHARGGNLETLAHYISRGLPLDLYFWGEYLDSKDREVYAGSIAEKIRKHVRGKRLVDYGEEELHLAYAGLSSPDGLTFRDFENDILKKTPPMLFLYESFSARTKHVRSVHASVDRGKLLAAIRPWRFVADEDSFKHYLRRVIEKSNGALHHFREELEAEFPKGIEWTRLEDFRFKAPWLIGLLWPGRKTPPVRDLIFHIALLDAWHRLPQEEQSTILAAVDKEISSESLLESLKATEEFYRDSIEDAMRRAGFEGHEIPFIRKQRKILKAELGRIEDIKVDLRTVKFVPSKSQADQFFGKCYGDCNRDDRIIHRYDFQLYRMISRDRHVGGIYLQKAKLDGKKVLVMGIQPKSSWNIDHENLLRVIETEFSRIASENGYDYLLIMGDDHQLSNRFDILAAIEKRKYDEISFKESVSGATFAGNEFRIVWKRK